MRLTDISVRGLTAPPKGSKIYYDDNPKGFGVRVSYAGTKAFILAVGDNRDRTTIGRYPTVSLAEARQIARNLLAERQLGRHQAPKTTLGAALDIFAEQHIADLAPRTRTELARLFKRYLTKLRTKKLADIITHDITRITDKAALSEAEHLHRACKTFFRWCVRRRMLQHSPLEGLELPSMWKLRERVLSDDELKTVWAAAQKMRGVFGRIVQLLALTGQRRGEIAALEADWIGEDSITLPASICKNKRQHCFPIGTLTKSIAQPCSFNSFSKAKEQLDKLAKIEPWTLHDLRRTDATNLQRLGIRLEVIEALLNHVSGTRAGIVGVYNRHRYEAEMRDAVSKYDTWFNRTILIHEEV